MRKMPFLLVLQWRSWRPKPLGNAEAHIRMTKTGA